MKRIMSLLIGFALMIIVLTVGFGSSGTSGPTNPTYTFTPGAKNLYLTDGQAVNFVITSSKDDPGYTYAWTATGGTPTSGTAKTFSWTAPLDVGEYTVTATVTKDSSPIGAKSWTVEVCERDSISGKVLKYYSESASALPNVSIDILGTGIDIYHTTTDSLGKFSFTDVPSGLFSLRFTESSFKTLYCIVDLRDIEQMCTTMFTTADMVALLETIGVTGLDLNTKSVVFGNIVDNDHKTPISGATVAFTPSSGTFGYYDAGGMFNLALTATSNNGGFVAFNVGNGTYTITPAKNDKTFSSVELSINESALFKEFFFAE